MPISIAEEWCGNVARSMARAVPKWARDGTVSNAYDSVAPEYDGQLEDDVWMRRILWKHFDKAFGEGGHVLDVGCGTGTDAVYLARRGIRVAAIDISPAMIAQAEGKVASCGVKGGVTLNVLDIGDLGSLPASEFDGLISSFASLNSLPPVDGVPGLSRFAEDAHRVLRPGGRVILHLLNASSLWEWTGLVARGRWNEARQLGGRRERILRVGGQPVLHQVPQAAEAYERYFKSGFRLCRAFGLGITRPPCPVAWVPTHVMSALGRLDELVGPHYPFINWGRFVVLEMEALA
jgi:ubiquinone/menaquinone biosynthesis C-methylase UbiE